MAYSGIQEITLQSTENGVPTMLGTVQHRAAHNSSSVEEHVSQKYKSWLNSTSINKNKA